MKRKAYELSVSGSPNGLFKLTDDQKPGEGDVSVLRVRIPSQFSMKGDLELKLRENEAGSQTFLDGGTGADVSDEDLYEWRTNSYSIDPKELLSTNLSLGWMTPNQPDDPSFWIPFESEEAYIMVANFQGETGVIVGPQLRRGYLPLITSLTSNLVPPYITGVQTPSLYLPTNHYNVENNSFTKSGTNTYNIQKTDQYIYYYNRPSSVSNLAITHDAHATQPTNVHQDISLGYTVTTPNITNPTNLYNGRFGTSMGASIPSKTVQETSTLGYEIEFTLGESEVIKYVKLWPSTGFTIANPESVTLFSQDGGHYYKEDSATFISLSATQSVNELTSDYPSQAIRYDFGKNFTSATNWKIVFFYSGTSSASVGIGELEVGKRNTVTYPPQSSLISYDFTSSIDPTNLYDLQSAGACFPFATRTGSSVSTYTQNHGFDTTWSGQVGGQLQDFQYTEGYGIDFAVDLVDLNTTTLVDRQRDMFSANNSQLVPIRSTCFHMKVKLIQNLTSNNQTIFDVTQQTSPQNANSLGIFYDQTKGWMIRYTLTTERELNRLDIDNYFHIFISIDDVGNVTVYMGTDKDFGRVRLHTQQFDFGMNFTYDQIQLGHALRYSTNEDAACNFAHFAIFNHTMTLNEAQTYAAFVDGLKQDLISHHYNDRYPQKIGTGSGGIVTGGFLEGGGTTKLKSATNNLTPCIDNDLSYTLTHYFTIEGTSTPTSASNAYVVKYTPENPVILNQVVMWMPQTIPTGIDYALRIDIYGIDEDDNSFLLKSYQKPSTARFPSTAEPYTRNWNDNIVFPNTDIYKQYELHFYNFYYGTTILPLGEINFRGIMPNTNFEQAELDEHRGAIFDTTKYVLNSHLFLQDQFTIFLRYKKSDNGTLFSSEYVDLNIDESDLILNQKDKIFVGRNTGIDVNNDIVTSHSVYTSKAALIDGLIYSEDETGRYYYNTNRLLLSFPFDLATTQAEAETNYGSITSFTLNNSGMEIDLDGMVSKSADQDYFQISNISLSSTFTVYFKWMKPGNVAGDSYPTLLQLIDSSNNPVFSVMIHDGGTNPGDPNNNLMFIKYESTNQKIEPFGNATFSNDFFYHTFVTIDTTANEFKVYMKLNTDVPVGNDDNYEKIYSWSKSFTSFTTVTKIRLGKRIESAEPYDIDAVYASFNVFDGGMTLVEAQEWANYVDNNFIEDNLSHSCIIADRPPPEQPFLSPTAGSISSLSIVIGAAQSGYTLDRIIDGSTANVSANFFYGSTVLQPDNTKMLRLLYTAGNNEVLTRAIQWNRNNPTGLGNAVFRLKVYGTNDPTSTGTPLADSGFVVQTPASSTFPNEADINMSFNPNHDYYPFYHFDFYGASNRSDIVISEFHLYGIDLGYNRWSPSSEFWTYVDLTSATTLNFLRLFMGHPGLDYTPSRVIIEGGNSISSWTELGDFTIPTNDWPIHSNAVQTKDNSLGKNFRFDNTTAYRYYRFRFPSFFSATGDYLVISEMEWGREVPKTIIESGLAPRKWEELFITFNDPETSGQTSFTWYSPDKGTHSSTDNFYINPRLLMSFPFALGTDETEAGNNYGSLQELTFASRTLAASGRSPPVDPFVSGIGFQLRNNLVGTAPSQTSASAEGDFIQVNRAGGSSLPAVLTGEEFTLHVKFRIPSNQGVGDSYSRVLALFGTTASPNSQHARWNFDYETTASTSSPDGSPNTNLSLWSGDYSANPNIDLQTFPNVEVGKWHHFFLSIRNGTDGLQTAYFGQEGAIAQFDVGTSQGINNLSTDPYNLTHVYLNSNKDQYYHSNVDMAHLYMFNSYMEFSEVEKWAETVDHIQTMSSISLGGHKDFNEQFPSRDLFSGDVSHLRIFDGVLSPDEREAVRIPNYETLISYDFRNSNTAKGGTLDVTYESLNGASNDGLQFTSAGGITIPNTFRFNSSFQEFTIYMRFKLENLVGGLIFELDSNGLSYALNLHHYGFQEYLLEFDISAEPNIPAINRTVTGTTLQVDRFYNYFISISGDRVNIYQDEETGMLLQQHGTSITRQMLPLDNSVFTFCEQSSGFCTDLRFYSRALTIGECQERMHLQSDSIEVLSTGNWIPYNSQTHANFTDFRFKMSPFASVSMTGTSSDPAVIPMKVRISETDGSNKAVNQLEVKDGNSYHLLTPTDSTYGTEVSAPSAYWKFDQTIAHYPYYPVEIRGQENSYYMYHWYPHYFDLALTYKDDIIVNNIDTTFTSSLDTNTGLTVDVYDGVTSDVWSDDGSVISATTVSINYFMLFQGIITDVAYQTRASPQDAWGTATSVTPTQHFPLGYEISIDNLTISEYIRIDVTARRFVSPTLGRAYALPLFTRERELVQWGTQQIHVEISSPTPRFHEVGKQMKPVYADVSAPYNVQSIKIWPGLNQLGDYDQLFPHTLEVYGGKSFGSATPATVPDQYEPYGDDSGWTLLHEWNSDLYNYAAPNGPQDTSQGDGRYVISIQTNDYQYFRFKIVRGISLVDGFQEIYAHIGNVQFESTLQYSSDDFQTLLPRPIVYGPWFGTHSRIKIHTDVLYVKEEGDTSYTTIGHSGSSAITTEANNSIDGRADITQLFLDAFINHTSKRDKIEDITSASKQVYGIPSFLIHVSSASPIDVYVSYKETQHGNPVQRRLIAGEFDEGYHLITHSTAFFELTSGYYQNGEFTEGVDHIAVVDHFEKATISFTPAGDSAYGLFTLQAEAFFGTIECNKLLNRRLGFRDGPIQFKMGKIEGVTNLNDVKRIALYLEPSIENHVSSHVNEVESMAQDVLTVLSFTISGDDLAPSALYSLSGDFDVNNATMTSNDSRSILFKVYREIYDPVNKVFHTESIHVEDHDFCEMKLVVTSNKRLRSEPTDEPVRDVD